MAFLFQHPNAFSLAAYLRGACRSHGCDTGSKASVVLLAVLGETDGCVDAVFAHAVVVLVAFDNLGW